MRYLIRLITLCIIFYSADLMSQDRPITMQECITIALQNNSAKFQSIEEYKSSVAKYRMARAKRSIIIDGQIRTIETDKDSDDSSTTVNLPGVDSYIGIYGGLVMSYNIVDTQSQREMEASRILVDISRINNQKTIHDIELDVKKAYIGYLLARKSLEVRKKIHKKYQTKSDLAKQLFENGTRPILDVSKSEVDLANSQLELNKAENNERKMKLNLFHAMGIEDSGKINLLPKDFDKIPELIKGLDSLFGLAQLYNPMIRKSKLSKRFSKMKISAEKAAYFPKVNFSMGFGYKLERIYGDEEFSKNYDTSQWSPVVYGLFTATIPLYRGGVISSRIDSALSDYNRSIFKEKEITSGVKTKIRNDFESLDEIKKQIEVSDLVIDNAERHLLLAQRSYENGVGSIVDLQDAELTVIKARMGSIQYRYNYFLTIASLSYLAGVKEEMICKKQED